MTMNKKIHCEWIAVDWGTTHLRVWAMDAEDNVLASQSSAEGMSSLTPEQFEPTLLALIADWLQEDRCLPVMSCGMLGASQGWHEAPYQQTPCAPSQHLTRVPMQSQHIDVYICAGLKQISPADVMRGEETQIAGLFTEYPDFNGVICLPGTHSKWSVVKDQSLTQFNTFMTGELFSLISKQSILRHQIDSDAFDEPIFIETVKQVLEQPEKSMASLFRIRADGLLNNLPAGVALARLSGILIGSELASASDYWLPVKESQGVIHVIGSSALAHCYQLALATQACKTLSHDVSTMTRNGLIVAYHNFKKEHDVCRSAS